MNQSGGQRYNPYGRAAAIHHSYGNNQHQNHHTNNSSAKHRDTTYCSSAENAHLLKTDYIHNPFYTQRFFITKPHILNVHQNVKDNSDRNRMHEVRFRMPFDWYQKVSSQSEKYELILRVYETKAAHVDYLPHDVKITLNERDAKTPNMVPASHADVKPRPQAKPIIISQQLRPRTSNMNVVDCLKISWYHCDGKKGRPTPEMSYVLTVVREYSHAEATDRIKRLKRPREISMTQKLLQSKLANNKIPDVQQTSTLMKLRCPVTMMPIKCPVRFDNCEHLECFDAGNYLQMNAKKPAWSCPICNKRLPFGTLRIDKWFQEILIKAGSNVREIELDSSGNFKITDKDDEEEEESNAPAQPIEVIEL